MFGKLHRPRRIYTVQKLDVLNKSGTIQSENHIWRANLFHDSEEACVYLSRRHSGFTVIINSIYFCRLSFTCESPSFSHQVLEKFIIYPFSTFVHIFPIWNSPNSGLEGKTTTGCLKIPVTGCSHVWNTSVNTFTNAQILRHIRFQSFCCIDVMIEGMVIQFESTIKVVAIYMPAFLFFQSIGNYSNHFLIKFFGKLKVFVPEI